MQLLVITYTSITTAMVISLRDYPTSLDDQMIHHGKVETISDQIDHASVHRRSCTREEGCPSHAAVIPK